MTATFADITNAFLACAKLTDSFEEAFVAVAGYLSQANESLQNPHENWMMVFDALHFKWECEGKPPVPVEQRDDIALRWAPDRNEVAKIIERQRQTADDWATELAAAGMTPEQALGQATEAVQMLAAKEQAYSAVSQPKGVSPIALPMQIVRLYRTFYRASKRYRPDRIDAIRPLFLAKEVIQKSRATGEDLKLEVAGKLAASMRRIHRRNANGWWVIADEALERQAISEFAEFIVFHVLAERFRGDRSRFSSREIVLIEDACFFLYQLEQDKENREAAK